mmetsp:Transcript_10928/g.26264  ORF Transcript_10928/g.26264 Transcript_10928/m.26264 type:complete len:598 (+) Transcript_10928:120-1913(+)
MTKISAYDELEIDERPRVCGGVVFQRFMKKAKCRSSIEKNEVPALTSSSSFSSSQASSTSLNNMYDPSKTHFCMPRQIEGVGTTIATESDSSKLDFQLQLEEHPDLSRHNEFQTMIHYDEDGTQSNSIIQLNPQVVNDLKTKHMHSLEDKRLSEEPERGSQVPVRDSTFELAMGLRSNSERAFSFEESMGTRRSVIAMDDADDVDKNGDADAAWDDIQKLNIEPSSNGDQRVYESKASFLRKEMTSFRKELNAVKKSLPNRFQPDTFNESDGEGGKVLNEGPNLNGRDLYPITKSPPNQLKSNDNVNQDGNSKVKSFWSGSAEKKAKKTVKHVSKNPAKDSPKKQTQDTTNRDKNYFKNDWNLDFDDNPNTDMRNELILDTPSINNSNVKDQGATQISEKASSTVGTDEIFPEYPEMPFDQDLSQEEKELNDNASLEDKDWNAQSSTCDERKEYITSPVQEIKDTDNLENENVEDPTKSWDKRESTEDDRVSTKSNYEKDMELVRLLLRKYSEDVDEKERDEKVKRIQAVVDVPTDAWFHRHAVGMCKNSNKLSPSKVDEAYARSHNNRRSIISEKNATEPRSISRTFVESEISCSF